MKKRKSSDVLQEYWSDNRRFADLFNGVIFGGEEMLRAEDLSEMDTAVAAVVKAGEDAYSIARYRDVIKKFTKDAGFVILALENQQNIHYAMPVRKMLYDALGYTRQCKQIEAGHGTKDYEDSHEFLSRYKKTDKLIPIFTIVLYYGEKDWDGPLSLTDMMVMNESFRPYISDYKIDLVQVRRPDLSYMFRTEVGQFFRLMTGLKDIENLHRYWQKHPEEVIDTDTAVAAATASESKKLEKFVKKHQKGGSIRMCTAIEDLMEEGRNEGWDQVNLLNQKLAETGRVDDIIRASSDREYQKKLFEEFEI